MKKFFKNLIICFFILVIFAAAVFFIGWTQIRIKPDCVGIVKSKTGGISKDIVYPGKFSWHWEFLLPTNAKFTSFELKPYAVSKSVSGKLPSGEVYAEILNDNVDFSYNFDFDFSVNISAENIVSLFERLVISEQDGLERFVEQECDSAAKMLSSEIIKKLSKDSLYNPDILTYEDLKSMVDFNKKFPELQFNSIVIKNCKYPDYALYEKSRSVYLSNLANVGKLPVENAQKK